MGRRLLSALLIPVMAPAAMLGLLYFIVTKRHPSPQLLMLFGASVVIVLVAVAVMLVTPG